MKKICFVGSLSTGKTELAIQLIKELVRKGYRVKLAKEYALDYHRWYRVKSVADQYFIMLGQREREERAESQHPDFVVCDGSQIHSFVYHFLYQPPLERKKEWAGHQMITQIIKKELWKALPSYDYIFFLPIEFEAKRIKGRRYYKKRYEISLRIRAFLDTFLWIDHYLWKNHKRPSWYVIRGNLKERINRVLEIILEA